MQLSWPAGVVCLCVYLCVCVDAAVCFEASVCIWVCVSCACVGVRGHHQDPTVF